MSWLMIAGGAPMVLIVVFGLLGLVSAGRYAWAPVSARLGHVVALGIAVVFASLSGVAANLIAVSIHVPANPEWAQSPDLPLIVLAGVGEALAPVVLGFSIVSVQALFTAVGLRRAG